MKEQLEKRLAELKSEFEAGQKMMTELESKQSNLRDTLLRISGAIQILEEEINRVDETLDSVQETPVEIIN
jgi:predicted nuclease with TOPRIM domain